MVERLTLLLVVFALMLGGTACPVADDDDSTSDDDDTAPDDADTVPDDDDTAPDDDDTAGPVPCSSLGGIVLSMSSSVGVGICGMPWTDQGVVFNTNPYAAPTCPQPCAAFNAGPAFWLAPAELFADLLGVSCTVSSVEVDLTEVGSPGLTTVSLTDPTGAPLGSATSTMYGVLETVTVSTSGQGAVLSIQSCEALISEVRLY